MRLPTIALLLAVLPQDETAIEEWIRQLEDDAVAVRDKAFAALVQAGPAAEPALRKAAEGGSAEVRERASDALRALGWKKRYDPGPSLITLRREKAPLKEILEELKKQSSTPLEISSVKGEAADAPVSVDLEKVPLFRALETLCRSHGKLNYETRCGWGEEPRMGLYPAPFVPCPRVVDGAVEVRLSSIIQEVRIKPGGAMSGQTTFEFEWKWEKGTRPLTGRLEIEELKDDADNSYAERLEEVREDIRAHHVDTNLERKMPCVPPEGVTKFSVIKGALIVVLPLTVQEFEFADPASLVGKSMESRWGSVKLTEFEPGKTVFHAKVETRPEDLVNRLTIALLDKSGKPIQSHPRGTGHMGDHGFLTFDFPKEEGREPATLKGMAEVGRRERRIAFEFRDVRFR